MTAEEIAKKVIDGLTILERAPTKIEQLLAQAVLDLTKELDGWKNGCMVDARRLCEQAEALKEAAKMASHYSGFTVMMEVSGLGMYKVDQSVPAKDWLAKYSKLVEGENETT